MCIMVADDDDDDDDDDDGDGRRRSPAQQTDLSVFITRSLYREHTIWVLFINKSPRYLVHRIASWRHDLPVFRWHIASVRILRKIWNCARTFSSGVQKLRECGSGITPSERFLPRKFSYAKEQSNLAICAQKYAKKRIFSSFTNKIFALSLLIVPYTFLI